MLDVYDDALLRFFRQVIWKGNSVPVVFAGADRAHSKIKEWLEKVRGLKASKAKTAQALPYPFIAIWREIFKPEMSSPVLLRSGDPERKGYGFAMRRPTEDTSGVDINIYLDDLVQRNNLILQIKQMFANMQTSYIPIDFEDPKWYKPPNDIFEFAKVLGKADAQIDLESITDSSNIEDSGLNSKEIRLTLSCVLHGWTPFKPYKVPSVQEVEFSIRDYETSAELMKLSHTTDE